MKIFRRTSSSVWNLGSSSSNTTKFFRATIESSAASTAAPLGPSLGQLQIPLVEFCDSFNEVSVAHYNDSVDLSVQLEKYESKYIYNIQFPTVNFLLKQLYLFYDFDLENYVYDYYSVLLEDLWFIIRIFSSVNSFEKFKSAQLVFGYLYSSIVRKIIFLITFDEILLFFSKFF